MADGRYGAPPSGDPEPTTAAEPGIAELEAFRSGLRLFAARRLRDAAEAEDVAQETLRRALEALQTGRIENVAALPAFLFQTARHICMHRGRSAAREGKALRRFAAGAEENDPPPLVSLIREERQREVRLALSQLEGADREVLELSYGQELDTKEIGSRLGLSAGAVRVRRHRAIRRLAELLSVTVACDRERKD